MFRQHQCCESCWVSNKATNDSDEWLIAAKWLPIITSACEQRICIWTSRDRDKRKLRCWRSFRFSSSCNIFLIIFRSAVEWIASMRYSFIAYLFTAIATPWPSSFSQRHWTSDILAAFRAPYHVCHSRPVPADRQRWCHTLWFGPPNTSLWTRPPNQH